MPSVLRVPVSALDRDRLAPFGAVLDAGTTDDPALNRAPGHMAYLWIREFLSFPSQPFVANVRYRYRGPRCDYLQRHPVSHLVLAPIDGRPSVVWLVPDVEGEPQLDHAQAVLLDGRQGVVIRPGVWLRYAYPILEVADFVTVSSRTHPEADIERIYLERDRDVVLEWYFGTPEVAGVQVSSGGVVVELPPGDGGDLTLGAGGLIERADKATDPASGS